MRRHLTEALRQPRDLRGVTPILATILLVAIVVVLAAVLYVVTTRLTDSGGPHPPLGTSLYVGPARAVQGTSSTNAFCQTSHPCYNVPVASATSGVTLGGLGFKVVSSTGTLWEVTKNYARLSIVGVDGAVLAYSQLSKNSAFAVGSWQHFGAGASATTMVESSMDIVVQFGNPAANPGGTGLTLVVYGTAAYSGSISAALP
ncbi:MAG: hypothetical protein L3K16_06620 [Thermoplasmata archaeon]|nr:hypothetical protein [Thermoplasmata archaeon]